MFIPLAYVIGVDGKEVEDVALLLGLKTVVNEFVAYERLTQMKEHLSVHKNETNNYNNSSLIIISFV